MKYKKKILKNGMRVIAVPMQDTDTVTVLTLVEAGSKYEDKNNNGISHFLEHMCFKGTEKRPSAMAINKELDGLGAETNAFTSEEFTGYYAKAHRKHLSKLVDVISDLYLNPVFPSDELEKEKGVTIQEIKMYDDMPRSDVWHVFAELMYGDQPSGRTILGPEKNIRKMKREDFIKYRNEHYVAEATLMVVAGKCEPNEVFKLTEKAFRNISRSKKVGKQKVKEIQKTPALKVKDKKTDQTHLVIGFRSFDIYDKRVPAIDVLAGVLGKGMSSRLFQKLREEMGVCYYVRANTNEFTDHGYLAVSTGVDKKRVQEVVRVLLGEFNKLKRDLVSEEELKKVKEYLIGHLFLDLETSDSVGEFYGFQEIHRQKIKTPEESKKEIEKVTAKDVRDIARFIFQDKNLNLALLGEIKDKSSLKRNLTLRLG